MNIRQKSIGTLLYTIMFITISISSYYYSSVYTKFNLPLIIVAIIPQIIFFTIGSFKIFIYDHHDRSEWAVIIVMFVLSLLMLIASDLEVGIMFLYVIVFAAKGINFKQFLKTFVFTMTPLFILTVLLASIGIIPDLMYGNRHSLGICYPTDLGAYVFYYFLAFSFLKDQYNFVYCIEGIILAAFVIVLPIARLDFGMILITTIAFLIYGNSKTFYSRQAVRTLILLSALILCLLSFAIAFFYPEGNLIMDKLNALFSGRFELSHRAFSVLPVTLFGDSFTMVGVNTHDPNSYLGFFLDNYYILSFFRYGLVGLIIIVTSMTLTEIYSYKTENYKVAIVFLMLAGTSFVDQHYIEPNLNAFLPCIGIAIYAMLNKKKITKVKVS